MTAIDRDFKTIGAQGAEAALREIEEAELSDVFWEVGLPQQMNVSSTNHQILSLFFAAQAQAGDRGFLSRDIRVVDLVEQRGDIHHFFPRAYLKKLGRKRREYNQLANFVLTQQEINLQIGSLPPQEYMATVRSQVENGGPEIGGIESRKALEQNLRDHCIPETEDFSEEGYEDFLVQRRLLMARRLRRYFEGL